MTAPKRRPRPGELWADPAGDEWKILPDGWITRPAPEDLTGWRLAAGADPPEVTILARAAEVAVPQCPACKALDTIAEEDTGGRLSRITFTRGIDNPGLYFTIDAADPNTPTARYCCRACGATLGIPADIALAV